MRPVSQQNELCYQFDEFELEPVRRVLLRDGKKIALKPKVFETLLVLIRNSGRVMDKDELMQQVWPDTVVEESTWLITSYDKGRADLRHPVVS